MVQPDLKGLWTCSHDFSWPNARTTCNPSCLPIAPGSELTLSNTSICFASRSPSQASALCTFGHQTFPWSWDLLAVSWIYENFSVLPPWPHQTLSSQSTHTASLSYFPVHLHVWKQDFFNSGFSFLNYEKFPQTGGFNPWLHYAQFLSEALGSCLGNWVEGWAHLSDSKLQLEVNEYQPLWWSLNVLGDVRSHTSHQLSQKEEASYLRSKPGEWEA